MILLHPGQLERPPPLAVGIERQRPVAAPRAAPPACSPSNTKPGCRACGPARSPSRCRPGRRPPARPEPCRSAGCTSDSARTARIATASGRCRRPPSIRCASASSKPMRTPIRSGWAAASRGPQVLVARLARAEHDEGRVETRQVVGERGNEVEALLIDHPRDHPDERPRTALAAGKPIRREHVSLRGRFAGQVGRRCTAPAETDRVAGSHCSVSMPFRMPTRSLAPLAQDAVEAEAELRRLNLAGVARADGRDRSARR